MNKEQQRKEFEQWLDTVIYDNSNILSPQGLAWEAWQAAQKEVTAAREELKTAIGQRDAIEESRVMTSNIYIKTAEQRDRLAEVIEAATVLIAAKGRHNTMLAYNGLRDALQSTTQPKKYDANEHQSFYP
jgi:hypothetical protein